MDTHRDRFLRIVRKPPDSSDAANVSARFEAIELADGAHYDMSEDYFRFMFASRVHPTNERRHPMFG